MAPPYLHPRSRMTSSLFATTLVASFFVVALPHVLPCPAPRVRLADAAENPAENATASSGDGVSRRRRRKLQRPHDPDDLATTGSALSATATDSALPRSTVAEVRRGDDGLARFALVQTDADATSNRRTLSEEGGRDALRAMDSRPRSGRVCPVPKPGGIVGELLGFGKHGNDGDGSAVNQERRGKSEIPPIRK